MTDPMHPLDPTNAADTPLFTGEGLMGEGGAFRWTDDVDLFWNEAFETRTYVPADARYAQYRGAYRYGHETAGNFRRGCQWVEVEPDVAAAWEQYEHRGECPADWNIVREAVRDGWERARRALRL